MKFPAVVIQKLQTDRQTNPTETSSYGDGPTVLHKVQSISVLEQFLFTMATYITGIISG